MFRQVGCRCFTYSVSLFTPPHIRWDTHSHPLADVHPTHWYKTLFPGQDYNNARIMDFQSVGDYASNQLNITESARMPWHDVRTASFTPIHIPLTYVNRSICLFRVLLCLILCSTSSNDGTKLRRENIKTMREYRCIFFSSVDR